jgi:hypothetical protein
MPTLAESAVVTKRGGDIPTPGSQAEEIIHSAWQVYSYINARASREGGVYLLDGFEGYEWTGNMEDVFHALWPYGASPLPLHEMDWKKSQSPITTWLITKRNLRVIERGREASSSSRNGTVPARSQHWWIALEFNGADGMRLPNVAVQEITRKLQPPEPEALKVDTGERKSQAKQATATATSPKSVEKDWWCPLANYCNQIEPTDKLSLSKHIGVVHKFKPGTFMHDQLIQEAGEVREEMLAKAGVAVESDPPPSPPPVTSTVPTRTRSLVDQPRSPAVAPPVTFKPPVPPAAPVQVPVGTLSAQAAVFAQQVAAMETENIGLKMRAEAAENRVKYLEDQLRDGTRLNDRDVDRIAQRFLGLLRSKSDQLERRPQSG